MRMPETTSNASGAISTISSYFFHGVVPLIVRLAFPGGKPRAKPGPYRGDVFLTSGEQGLRAAAVAQDGSAADDGAGTSNGAGGE